MLSTRLQMIFDIIPTDSTVVDVGCDHAYLAIELIKQKKSSKVYALDNKKGPLNQAKINVEQENLVNQVDLVLMDGLSDFKENVDTVVIAGMGVETAIEILENSYQDLKQFSQIVIQVNKNAERIREWIAGKEFYILDEDICFEDFYYQVIVFTTHKKGSYSKEELLLGPMLLQKKKDCYFEFIKNEIKKIDFILVHRNDDELKKKRLIYSTLV